MGASGLALVGAACSTQTTAPPVGAPTAPAAASGGSATPAAATVASTPRPKLGGALRTITTSAERNLEPHVSGGAGGTGGSGPYVCYSTLMTYKFGADVKPPSYLAEGELAESWTQPDDLTYVFKLRPGAKWHNIAPVNGRDLTADDIIYSFNRIRELKAYASLLTGITKMEAVDKATLKLTLDKPNVDFLNNLGVNNLVVVAKEVVEVNGGSLEKAPVIGSGPFIFEKLDLNQVFTAKKNPDYYRKGQPYVDRFESYRSADDNSLANAFRANQVDMITTTTVQIAEDIRKAVPGVNIRYIPSDRNTIELMLNTNLDMFKDVRVRQAISKAIDRQAIIDTVWLGKGELTTGLSLPDPSYAIPAAELGTLVGRDVNGAKQLLSQAGVSNLGFEIIAPTYLNGAFVSLTELIQANLKDVGINATIKTADTTTWSTAQQSLNFQGITGTFNGAAPNGWLATRYYTGGGQNWVKYSDPAMDRMIDQQAVLVKDPEGRKKILQDIQRKIINDAVYIPLILYYQGPISHPYVKDLYPPIPISGHTYFWTAAWVDK
jgi:peptide/nickel transport system substrate-binding protein